MKIKKISKQPLLILFLTGLSFWGVQNVFAGSQCSLNGIIYADQAACDSNCTQTANCTANTTNLVRDPGTTYDIFRIPSSSTIADNSKMYDGDFSTYSRTKPVFFTAKVINFSAIFSGPATVTKIRYKVDSTSGSVQWIDYYQGAIRTPFNSANLQNYDKTFYVNLSDVTKVAAGVTTLSTGSDSAAFYELEVQGYLDSSYSCPIPGGSACSGSPSTCSRTGICTDTCTPIDCSSNTCFGLPCWDGCQWQAGTKPCFACTGSNPANAALCAGDGTGLTSDTPKTAVSVCSVPAGSLPKCEYTCNLPYTLNGGLCICAVSCQPWSSCSATCGGGTQTQSCTDCNGGNILNSQACNTQACAGSSWREVAP